MSIYKDGQEYLSTHYWWDEDENDYELIATWQYEDNGSSMPSYWHLIEVELDYFLDTLPNHIVEIIRDGCQNGGNIWCDLSLIHIPSPRDRTRSRMPSSA